MQSIRSRPICRAHNAFSPSIALWQHFVPDQHLPQHSFATQATQSHDAESLDIHGKTGHSPLENTSGPIAVKRVGSRHPKEPTVVSQDDDRRKKQTQAWAPRGGYAPRTRPDAHALLEQARSAYDLAQDYHGVNVQPIKPLRRLKEDKLPWIPSGWQHVRSAEERLSLEIQAFHEYARPNHAESVARKHVIEQVRQHVQAILPSYVLEVFGSERTGVAFAGSDIDLRLVPKNVAMSPIQAKLPPNSTDRARRRKDLMRLHFAILRTLKSHYILPTIRWARYPLISIQDRASGLDIQLVLSNDTSISRDLMQRYMSDYSYLPQLYSIVKASLDIRGLTDVFRGGLGSYSLFMMIVASLKHMPHPRNDAAGGLLFFQRFWGSFEAEKHGVSIEPPEFFNKSEQLVMHSKAIGHIEKGKTQALPSWMLTLRDPADDTNDLGRKTTAWKHLRQTLRHLDESLRRDLKDNTRASLLTQHVGPVAPLHEARRRKLTRYGEYVAMEARKDIPILDIASNFMVARDAAKLESDRAAGNRPVAAKIVKKNTEPRGPDHDELASVALAIRRAESANMQTTRDTQALDAANGAANGVANKPEGDVNAWLTEVVGESSHRETGQAFSDLLGLDNKHDKHGE